MRSININNAETIFGYGKHIIGSFEFESGEVLQDVTVEYDVIGTPKFDEEGYITNAIVYCHDFNKNCISINDFELLMKNGASFDKNDYYFISITSLGYPDSCSPSTTQLKYEFPKYTIKDRVNFKREFIKEKFKIKKFLGIYGVGAGGYEVYTWACEYPEEMEFIIIIESSFKTNGYRYIISKAFENFIESSDDFYSDVYNISLSRMMISINILLYSNYFSRKTLQKISNEELNILMEDFIDESLFLDIYDFKYRNDAVLNYDVEDKLPNIEAEALIFSSLDEMYYSAEFDALPLKDMIKNSRIELFESEKRIDDEEYYLLFDEYITDFLSEFKIK